MIRLESIDLPTDLLIKRTWSPVQETRYYSGDGTLILQQQNKTGGRPLELSSQSSTLGSGSLVAPLAYSVIQDLEATMTAGSLTLVLHTETLIVSWDYQQVPLEWTPLRWQAPPQPDDLCQAILRFIELPA